MLGMKMNSGWVNVEKHILSSCKEKENCRLPSSPGDFVVLCATVGKLGELQAKSLLEYLNMWGTILYIRIDGNGEGDALVFPSPSWLMDVIKCIIDHRVEFKERLETMFEFNGGCVVTREAPSTYSEDMQNKLLRIFKAFKLAFGVDDDKFLFPSHLRRNTDVLSHEMNKVIKAESFPVITGPTSCRSFTLNFAPEHMFLVSLSLLHIHFAYPMCWASAPFHVSKWFCALAPSEYCCRSICVICYSRR